MQVKKIHQVYENTNNYHTVHVELGKVIIQRAEYMALVTAQDDYGDEFQQMLPMLMDEIGGELYVCGPAIGGRYVGIAKPGVDAIDLIDPDGCPQAIEWLKREGITELIVPGGDR